MNSNKVLFKTGLSKELKHDYLTVLKRCDLRQAEKVSWAEVWIFC